jgi:hypothetical protein
LRLGLCLQLPVLAYMVVLLLVMTLGPLARVLLLVREDMLHLSLILVVVGGCAVFSVVEGVRDGSGRQISTCFEKALAVVVEVG